MRTIDGLTSADYLRLLAECTNVARAQAIALRGVAGEMEYMDAEIAALKDELAAQRREGARGGGKTYSQIEQEYGMPVDDLLKRNDGGEGV